jgi:hypothetical protein
MRPAIMSPQSYLPGLNTTHLSCIQGEQLSVWAKDDAFACTRNVTISAGKLKDNAFNSCNIHSVYSRFERCVSSEDEKGSAVQTSESQEAFRSNILLWSSGSVLYTYMAAYNLCESSDISERADKESEFWNFSIIYVYVHFT